MQHSRDVWDIQTAGRDISRHEDATVSFLFFLSGGGEAFDGSQSRFLWHLAVQGVGGEVQVLEEWDEAADGVDAVREDQGAGGGEVAEEEGVEVEVFFEGGAFDYVFG